jgi:FkbM family methyltransferase
MLKLARNGFHLLASQKTRDNWYRRVPKPIKQVWDRFGPGPEALPPSKAAFEQVTSDDIYFCFRLFLKREPSAAEFVWWQETAKQLNYNLDILVHLFVHNEEYWKLQDSLSRPHLANLNDFQLYVRLNDYFVGAPLAKGLPYEPSVTARVRELLKPGGVFVDVGANVGYYTMMAASLVGATGKVIAFEPNPQNCELIQMSVQANDFNNVELYPLAVADQPGTVELLLEGTHSNARLLNPAQETAPVHMIKHSVSTVTLDEVLAGECRIDLIKLDIEGAEPRAWQGMQRLLQQHRPVILTEFFPDFIRMTSAVEPEVYLEMIRQQGYDIFVLYGTGPEQARANNTAVMHAYKQSGGNHIDLLARPS